MWVNDFASESVVNFEELVTFLAVTEDLHDLWSQFCLLSIISNLGFNVRMADMQNE